ncbi:hypothetical protein FNV62_52050 [Streptomyces sp. RLB3-17]|nr:hypothetical protein FNV58_53675 [Streptomyces sp. RLB1-9]QDO25288.1 hypothetical protein FNV65_52250 [Streptomyces sp. S1A1-8]QDO35409.1 hypothetical protein FNV63_52275 [Streptomyces sp. S1A1-3]QDO45426.1 hypothetical protein FNV62_52050 [Streptomyces sp. RLB3-17]
MGRGKRAEKKQHKRAVLALARRRVNVLFATIRDGQGAVLHVPEATLGHDPPRRPPIARVDPIGEFRGVLRAGALQVPVRFPQAPDAVAELPMRLRCQHDQELFDLRGRVRAWADYAAPRVLEDLDE